MDNDWTQEWPTEEGFYWFYSYRHGRVSVGEEAKPKLLVMEAMKSMTGIACVASGSFVHNSEPEEAWFKKIILPELPKDFKYTDSKKGKRFRVMGRKTPTEQDGG